VPKSHHRTIEARDTISRRGSHADVKLTLKVYSHTNPDAMSQALGKLDGRLS